ncbi:MAG: alpha/beta fold hydrolase [Solobacterium sp.]|nr:alpha/beta fold hydrolase [Solobacterium sp.]
MFIEDDVIRLHVELELPEQTTGAVPLLILIHGFTGNMEEAHLLAVRDGVRQLGFAVLRAEMYGHGQSGGSFTQHNLYKWLNNALTVIDYARSLEGISDLYLCGHSQGGLLVMLAAAMKADVIKGLVLLSPAAMIPENAREGTLLGIPFDPYHVPEQLAISEEETLSGNYIRVAQTIYPEQIAPGYQGPVLIVHGEADETVPVQVSKDCSSLYEQSKLVLIPGDTHCFDVHADQMVTAVTDWLRKQR